METLYKQRIEQQPGDVQNAIGYYLDYSEDLLVTASIMVEARGLAGVCRVGTFGAKKYSRFGFLSVDNGAERYREAGGRHLRKWLDGEDYDNEPGGSGEHHLDIWLWNMLAELTTPVKK